MLLMFMTLAIMANRQTSLRRIGNEAINSIGERDYAVGSVTLELLEISNRRDFSFAGESCQETILTPGKYFLEVWGAQGGSWVGGNPQVAGGHGGYSGGYITITATTPVLVCVGEQPIYTADYFATDANNAAGHVFRGGWNGGGSGVVHRNGNNANFSRGLGGGGGTDIRIGGNTINHRIIVAGGGSGGVRHSGATAGNQQAGYAGGGTAGQTGSANYAGTQTNGGTGAIGANVMGRGQFGVGGSATNQNQQHGPAGAGGGWFGGSVGVSGNNTGNRQQHGGGSGFVWTGQSLPSGVTLNGSHQLTGTSTIVGTSTMPNPNGGTMTGRAGHGFARITAVQEYSFSSRCRAELLPSGQYLLEAWGAQGGSWVGGNPQIAGGNGGYSRGIITLTEETTIFICVGGQPIYTADYFAVNTAAGHVFRGGWNGGGNGVMHRNGTSTSFARGLGGGGGTDIRIGGTTFDHRIIVAGGGSGGVRHSSTTAGNQQVGYAGGGTTGQTGTANFAGTQTNGGTGAIGANTMGRGQFGIGGSATNQSQQHGPAGAGGGWFGGSVGISGSGTGNRQQHGGGSGFVWTGQALPSGVTLEGRYQLTEASTTIGTSSMPNPNGGTMTGRAGHGFVRISRVG